MLIFQILPFLINTYSLRAFFGFPNTPQHTHTLWSPVCAANRQAYKSGLGMHAQEKRRNTPAFQRYESLGLGRRNERGQLCPRGLPLVEKQLRVNGKYCGQFTFIIWAMYTALLGSLCCQGQRRHNPIIQQSQDDVTTQAFRATLKSEMNWSFKMPK